MFALLKSFNLGLAFLLELAALVAFCYFGFNIGGTLPLKFLLGIGLPAGAIVIWAIWGAPMSKRRLSGAPFLLLQILFFGAAALALYLVGQHVLGFIFALVFILNTILAYAWDQKKAA